MSEWMKGAVLMSGFIGQALSAFFKESEEAMTHAKVVAGQAACRIQRQEQITDIETGERKFVWKIEFATPEDAHDFGEAVRGLVSVLVEGE